jgi:phage shock protein A
MWSKLFNWKKAEKKQTETETESVDVVRLALTEIDKNIAQNRKALHETQNTQIQIQEKLREQILELNSLNDKAEQALRKNDETQAKNLLGKAQWLKEQAQQYQHLLAQLAQTIQQLEKQIAGLEMRKVEIATKETLLTARLQKVTSEKEMQSYLGELDKTLGFDSFERQIEAISIENRLANDILAFDEALENSTNLPKDNSSISSKDNLPAQNIQSLQQKFAQEAQEKQAQKMNTIFGRYFDAQKTAQQDKKKTQDFQAMRQELFSSFFAPKETEEQQEQPKQPTPNIQASSKDKLITDFFVDKNTEPESQPKTDKQKQIDDFFGN